MLEPENTARVPNEAVLGAGNVTRAQQESKTLARPRRSGRDWTTMSQAKDTQRKRAIVGVRDAGQMESDSTGNALGAYLAGLRGRSCVLPFQRVRELTSGGLPGAAMSAGWWMDAEGWPASPAAAACRSAGWRLDSVTESARLVRFVHTGREEERIRSPQAGPRSAD